MNAFDLEPGNERPDSEKIFTALAALDPSNDEHWTREGLPVVAVVANLSGLLTLKRADITALAPDFDRELAAERAEQSGQSNPLPSAPSSADPEEEQALSLPSDDAPVSALRAERETLRAELDNVSRQRFDLQQREAALIRKIDTLTAEIEETEPDTTTQEAIREYIEAQSAARKARADRHQHLQNLGLGPDELRRPQAPIDAAFQRNARRGGARPVYPARNDQ